MPTLTVRLRDAEWLVVRLRAAGHDAREIVYPALGHVEILRGLSTMLSGNSRLNSDLAGSINEIATRRTSAAARQMVSPLLGAPASP